MATAERGPALAGPITAPRISGAPSFGPKPGSFESVRFSNPNLGRITIKGGDSPAPVPEFRFEPLRPRQLNSLRVQPVVESVPVPGITSETRPNKVRSIPVSQARKNIIFFPRLRPVDTQNILNQQLMLSRIRSSLLRSGSLLRAQPAVVINTETQARVEPAVKDSPKNTTSTEIKFQDKAEMPVKLNRVNTILAANRRRLISIQSEKVVIDDDMNKRRVNAIIATRNRMEASGQPAPRNAVIKESGVPVSDEFKSPILKWIKKADGTQPRTEEDLLSGEGEITDGEIEEGVNRHPALKSALNGTQASDKQVYEVATLPQEVVPSFDLKQILPKTQEIKEIESSEKVADARVFPTIAAREDQVTSLQEPEVKAIQPESFAENIAASPSRLLDRLVHNNVVYEFDELSERRKLVLAA